MSQLKSSNHLSYWAGLTPSNNQSAGKKKSVKISLADVYLKPALVQVVHASVKSKKYSYYSTKYQCISNRRGKKRTIIAISRMILVAIYHMFSTGEPFNPCDLHKFDIPEEIQHRQKEQAIKQAIKLLTKEEIADLRPQASLKV